MATGSATNLMPVAAAMTDRNGRVTYAWQQYFLNPAFDSVVLPPVGAAGTYGGANQAVTITVNAYGIATAVASTPIAISNTQVSGLGSMALQPSAGVSITGGAIDGVPIGNLAPATAKFTLLQSGAAGFNGAPAQTPAASGGAVAATGSTNVAPFGYTTAAQADAIVTLLNNIRAALVANGIMS